MKQNQTKGQKGLSLNKTTITKLQKSQMNNVKAGAGTTLSPDMTIGDTCGYVCGDCMSITIRTFAANTL
jgi:hypothetical protein